jgi:hypothetical protein
MKPDWIACNVNKGLMGLLPNKSSRFSVTNVENEFGMFVIPQYRKYTQEILCCATKPMICSHSLSVGSFHDKSLLRFAWHVLLTVKLANETGNSCEHQTGASTLMIFDNLKDFVAKRNHWSFHGMV